MTDLVGWEDGNESSTPLRYASGLINQLDGLITDDCTSSSGMQEVISALLSLMRYEQVSEIVYEHFRENHECLFKLMERHKKEAGYSDEKVSYFIFDVVKYLSEDWTISQKIIIDELTNSTKQNISTSEVQFIDMLVCACTSSPDTTNSIMSDDQFVSEVFGHVNGFLMLLKTGPFPDKVTNSFLINLLDNLRQMNDTFMNSEDGHNIFKSRNVFDRYLQCLETMMLFNVLKCGGDIKGYCRNVERDKSMAVVEDLLLSIGMSCLQRLEKGTLMEYISVLSERLNAFIAGSPLMEGHVSVFYPFLTLYSIALSFVDGAECQVNDIERYWELPLRMKKFLYEYQENMWKRYEDTAIYKVFIYTTFNTMKMSADIYLFQRKLCTNSKKAAEGLLMSIIRELGLSEISNIGDPPLSEEDIKIRSLCFLDIVYQIVVDPVLSCRLTNDEVIQYFGNHIVCAREKDIKKYIPRMFYPSMKVATERLISKLAVEPVDKKFINPLFPYIYFNDRDVNMLKNRISPRTLDVPPDVFMKQRRDPLLAKNITELLHSKLLLETCGEILECTMSEEVMGSILSLLRLIVLTDDGSAFTNGYTNSLSKLIEQISIKAGPLVNEYFCSWVLDHCKRLKRFCEQVEVLKTAGVHKKRDTTKLMKKVNKSLMKQAMKSTKSIQGSVALVMGSDEKLMPIQESECIICHSRESSERGPIGYLAHIEACNLVRNGRNVEWSNEWNCESDSQNFHVLSCCPHMVHFKCFEQIVKKDKEQRRPMYTFVCPECKRLYNMFVPRIDEGEGEQYRVIVNQECTDPLIASTIYFTVTSEIRNQNEVKFLTITHTVLSTIMTTEARKEYGVEDTKLPQIISLLHSYLYSFRPTFELADLQSKFELKLHEGDRIMFDKHKMPLLSLLRCIVLTKEDKMSAWNRLCRYANAHQLFHVLAYIQAHTEFHPQPTPLFQHIPKERNMDMSFSSIDEGVDRLVQSYMRQMALLKWVIFNETTNTSFEDHYDFPLEESETIIVNSLPTADVVDEVPYIMQPQPTYWNQSDAIFKRGGHILVELPETFEKLVRKTFFALHDGMTLFSCAICMACGRLVRCKNGSTDSAADQTSRPLLDHMHNCSGESGVFLIVHSSEMVIITSKLFSSLKGLYRSARGDLPDSDEAVEYNLDKELLHSVESYYLNGELSAASELTFSWPTNV